MSDSTSRLEDYAARDRLIVKWHARGHDALDKHGVPRIRDGIEFTIAERIDLLADIVAPPADEPKETTT